MTIRVTASGAESRPFRRYSWAETSRNWAALVGPVVEEALKREAPIAPGGGRLRDSIRYERRAGEGSLQLVYTANTPYAGFVLSGTRPHQIRPRRARALRFEQGGETRFARLVNHPGTRPNPFPERALRPLMPLIQQRFASIVSASLKG
jgi:hypothetical protein